MMKLRNKKTGEIWGNAVIESYLCAEGYRLIVKVNRDASLGKHYDSLAELNEEWEDYTPTEPLIKDEKKRKTVRDWLEANDLDGATYSTHFHTLHYWTLRGFNDNEQGLDIDFFLTGESIPKLIDGKYYTKVELCGEEEE